MAGFNAAGPASREIELAPPGEASLAVLPPETVNLRLLDSVVVHHGSSLSLISKVRKY